MKNKTLKAKTVKLVRQDRFKEATKQQVNKGTGRKKGINIFKLFKRQ